MLELVSAKCLNWLGSAWAGALFLALLSVNAAAQETFYETSLVASRRATTAGEAKKALRFYEKRAAQYESFVAGGETSQAALELVSRAYREASNAAFFLGDFQKAIGHGERALAIANEVNNPRLKLAVISSLHQAYRDIRNFRKAQEIIEIGLHATKAFSLSSFHRIWWESIFYNYRGSDYRRRGKYRRALDDFQKALDLKKEYLKRIPPNTGKWGEQRTEHVRTGIVLTYTRMGRAYLLMSKWDQALEYFEQALASTEGWNSDFAKVTVYYGLGDVRFHRGELGKARENYERALQLARRQRRVDTISLVARRMGDVLRQGGDTTAAMASYREAIEQIESIRSLLSSQRNRQSYFGGGLAAYTGLIETLWDRRDYSEAFHYGERVRSRSLLDMLGTKVRLSRADNELVREERALEESNAKGEQAYRDFLKKVGKANPEQASLMSVQPLTLKDVQRLLRPEQVLLEYLVTRERTYLWAVETTRLRAYTIPLARKDFVFKIESLRSAISNITPLDDYQRIARDLYDRLLSPVASEIKGKDLIVVPHDVLHYLPFHALYSPHGTYLAENHTVSYLSSASLLQFIVGKRRQESRKILAMGNPPSDADRGDLPLAEFEAAHIKNQFPASMVLLRKDASEAKIKELSPHYDILHFASHAELNEREPLKSAILLASNAVEDGRLEVQEIFGLNLNANLVVLSGCETGLGEMSNGDELVGLTRAFIYAGTPSVIASLWKVDDAATAHLMSSFYRNLKTMTKVEALRQAQLDVIRGRLNREPLAMRGVGGIGKLGETPPLRSQSQNAVSVSTYHPYFWAPFILVGDGK